MTGLFIHSSPSILHDIDQGDWFIKPTEVCTILRTQLQTPTHQSRSAMIIAYMIGNLSLGHVKVESSTSSFEEEFMFCRVINETQINITYLRKTHLSFLLFSSKKNHSIWIVVILSLNILCPLDCNREQSSI